MEQYIKGKGKLEPNQFAFYDSYLYIILILAVHGDRVTFRGISTDPKTRGIEETTWSLEHELLRTCPNLGREEIFSLFPTAWASERQQQILDTIDRLKVASNYEEYDLLRALETI